MFSAAMERSRLDRMEKSVDREAVAALPRCLRFLDPPTRTYLIVVGTVKNTH